MKLLVSISAAAVVVGLAFVAAPVSAVAGPTAVGTTAAETWLLRDAWGKPPTWFTVSSHPTKAECEEARLHRSLFAKCVLAVG